MIPTDTCRYRDCTNVAVRSREHPWCYPAMVERGVEFVVIGIPLHGHAENTTLRPTSPCASLSANLWRFDRARRARTERAVSSIRRRGQSPATFPESPWHTKGEAGVASASVSARETASRQVQPRFLACHHPRGRRSHSRRHKERAIARVVRREAGRKFPDGRALDRPSVTVGVRSALHGARHQQRHARIIR